jgi:hypothetical protein
MTKTRCGGFLFAGGEPRPIGRRMQNVAEAGDAADCGE